MAVGISGIVKGVLSGILSGVLIVILRQHGFFPLATLWDMFDAAQLSYIYELSILLASLLGGFLVVALVPRSVPARNLCPLLIVSGVVAWLINVISTRGDLSYLGMQLFVVGDLINLAGFSIAGGAIAYAFFHRTGGITGDGWMKSLIAGVAVAILMSVAYGILYLMFVNTDLSLGIPTQFQLYNFFEEISFALAGVTAGVLAAILISRCAVQPLSLFLQTGFSGAITGLISALFATCLATVSYFVDLSRPFSHGFLPYDASFVIFQIVQLAMLAIAGGMLYYSLSRETATAMPGSTASTK